MTATTEQASRLLHIEPDDDVHSLVKTVLSLYGVQEPIERIALRHDAYHMLRSIATNEHAVPEVIIINPNLSDEPGNADGRIMTKLIRKLGITSKIAVLISDNGNDSNLDYDFSFNQSRVEDLARYIRNLRG